MGRSTSGDDPRTRRQTNSPSPDANPNPNPDPQSPATPRRRRPWRRLLLAGLLLVASLAGLALALPWIVARPIVLERLVDEINDMVAPASVELASARLSWFAPPRLDGLALRDPRGKLVFRADVLEADKTILQIVRDPARLGVLTASGLEIDLERAPDGSIDLLDAVAALTAWTDADPDPDQPDEPALPDLALEIRILSGSLRVASPELTEPLRAESLAGRIHVEPAPEPRLRWNLQLANHDAESLLVEGHYRLDPTPDTLATNDQPPAETESPAPPRLALALTGVAWPLALARDELSLRGRLDGAAALAMTDDGAIALTGDARILDVQAAGRLLQGDRPRIERVEGRWDVDLAPDFTPRLRSLDLAAAPLARIRTTQPETGVTRVDARLDLAALARQIPRALHLVEGNSVERGEATLQLELTDRDGVQSLELTADVTPLQLVANGRAVTLDQPARLAAKLRRSPNDFTVENLAAKTDFLDVQGGGDQTSGVKLTGVFDLDKLQDQLRQIVDFGGVELAGRGGLAATYHRDPQNPDAYSAWLGVELRKIAVVGLLPDTFAQDAARLDVRLLGPVGPDGLPADWAKAQLDVKATDHAARAVAERRGDVIAISAASNDRFPSVKGPGGQPGLGRFRLGGRWLGASRAAEIAEARVDLHAPSTPPLRLALKGRWDLAAGELLLQPLATVLPNPNPNPNPNPDSRNQTPAEPDILALHAQGLKLAGLNPEAKILEAEGGLQGDAVALREWWNAWNPLFAPWTGADDPETAPPRLGAAANPANPADAAVAPAANLPRTPPQPELPPGSDSPLANEPFSILFKGRYDRAADRVALDHATLVSRYATIEATGSLAEPAGRRLADLRGVVTPNPVALRQLAANLVEPGARIECDGRPFRVAGPLAGESLPQILAGLDAEIGLTVTRLGAFGLNVERPFPLEIRAAAGKVRIAPIETAVNGGPVLLRPALVLDDPRGLALRLETGSFLRDVAVNEEVSRKLLSYVAPVLHEATQIQGRVSLEIESAEIPLADAPDWFASLVGELAFNDLVCRPGPFTTQMIALAGRRENLELRLDQPVQLAVADRRVVQRGLSFPVARDARVEIAGSVGFDQTLALQASLPIPSRALGNRVLPQQLFSGQTVLVPIGGTLARPALDRRALDAALRDAGRNILRRGLDAGADELRDQLRRQIPGAADNPPNDFPDQPPPDNDPGAAAPVVTPPLPQNQPQPRRGIAGEALRALDDLLRPAPSQPRRP